MDPGNSRDEAVGYAIAEGDESYGHKGRNGVSNIGPVDRCHLADHQAADLESLSISISSSPGNEHDRGLTKIRVHPVAHGGIEAKMGAKNTDTRKHSPVTIAVNPVLPPSAIPAPLSINAVTGEHPSNDPMEMHAASIQ